jgi:hypothetical protein
MYISGWREYENDDRPQNAEKGAYPISKLRLVISGLSGDGSICLPILLAIRSVNVSGLAEIPKTGRAAILIRYVATFQNEQSCMMRAGLVEAIASENPKIDLST